MTAAQLGPSVTRRGTTNRNVRGNNTTRRQRREWLVETYRADVDLLDGGLPIAVPLGEGEPACRCYRCAALLTVETVTADRIKPGIEGGTYGTPRRDRRDGRTNVRPSCIDCASTTGGQIAQRRRLRSV